MTRAWEYLVRLQPAMVRCGEPLTVHVEKAKLEKREDGLTLELYELDNFIYRAKGRSGWTVIEDEGKPFEPDKQQRNPDDLIASWRGSIVLRKEDNEVRFYFVPTGDVTLAERIQKEKQARRIALETKYGRLIPIRFDGSPKVWEIPMPFDGTAEDARSGEGPRLELAVSLKRGNEVLYQGGVQAFVEDWRWWASTSFAPPRAGNEVEYFADGEEYFARLHGAIKSAERYIYITDWKLNPYTVLLRDVPPSEPAYPVTAYNAALPARPSKEWHDRSVANLLEAAAKRNVRVRVLLWFSAQKADNIDDMTACYLMDRGIAVAAHNPAGENNTGGISWSNHQKTVVVDGKVAFVGGLDLAENRWDTPDHAAFDFIADPNAGYLSGRDVHKDRFRCRGFHSGNDDDSFFAHNERHGVDLVKDRGAWGERHLQRRSDRATLPRDRVARMPWHDVQCELHGPSVHDVERNFVQRWNRSWQPSLERFENAPRGNAEYFMKKKYKGLLFDPKPVLLRWRMARRQAEHCRHLDAVAWWDEFIFGRKRWGPFVDQMRAQARKLLTALPDLPLEAPQKPSGGKNIVQVLRSLEAESIVPAAHIKVERSIQECYLRAIESAEHYIYIETQMFLSRFIPGMPLTDHWDKDQTWDHIENQLAPRLLEKIKRKIKAGVPFHVYIVLPEIYDGDPFGDASQEIQLYQYLTLATLIHAIEQAAKEAGVDGGDYLTVYALRTAGITSDGEGRVRSNLVYVHSKLMIVDDVFLTMGSANANARSMDGYRDTELNVAVVGERDFEIRLGHHPWMVNKGIHLFRLRLWREHLGPRPGDYLLSNASHPHTIKFWREAGRNNWMAFRELFDQEMKLLDLIDKEREVVRAVNAKPASAAHRAAELTALRGEQDRVHAKTLELYAKVKAAGHIIDHPFRSRREAKGSAHLKIPDTIPK